MKWLKAWKTIFQRPDERKQTVCRQKQDAEEKRFHIFPNSISLLILHFDWRCTSSGRGMCCLSREGWLLWTRIFERLWWEWHTAWVHMVWFLVWKGLDCSEGFGELFHEWSFCPSQGSGGAFTKHSYGFIFWLCHKIVCGGNHDDCFSFLSLQFSSINVLSCFDGSKGSKNIWKHHSNTVALRYSVLYGTLLVATHPTGNSNNFNCFWWFLSWLEYHAVHISHGGRLAGLA